MAKLKEFFVAMPYDMLPTNFPLNIFIFEARTNFTSVIQTFCMNKYAKKVLKLFVAMLKRT